MKTIMKTTLATLAFVVGASASQAATVWHFPYKGAPYATQSALAQQVAPAQTVRHGKHVHVKTASTTQDIR